MLGQLLNPRQDCTGTTTFRRQWLQFSASLRRPASLSLSLSLTFSFHSFSSLSSSPIPTAHSHELRPVPPLRTPFPGYNDGSSRSYPRFTARSASIRTINFRALNPTATRPRKHSRWRFFGGWGLPIQTSGTRVLELFS